jgi:pyruvate dehydrogenase E1 component beta subunit
LTKVRELTYSQAINEGLREEMEQNDNIILMGEDIGKYGGVYKITNGLYEKFGEERVRDTPISENAIIGAAIGASLLGLKPVVEIMYMDFLNECGDQLVNHLPKIQFMSGGQLKTPVVVRTQFSTGRYTGAQHAQCFPAFYMNIPGFNIVLPASPSDAKGLIKTAIKKDSPTLYIESAKLYNLKGPVSEEEYLIPFGKAKTRIEGDDITLIAFSLMVPLAISVARKLKRDGISASVLDPRTLNPLDEESILKAVKKTGKVVIVEPDCKTAGIGAEIAALIAEKAIYYLDAPILRVASLDCPSPFSPPLLDNYYPTEDKILEAINKIV